MRFKIDKDLERVYSANKSHCYTSIESFSKHLCCRLLDAGLIEDIPENYGNTLSDATSDQLVANVCAVLCECLNVDSIDSDIFAHFCSLILMGDKECPDCGGELLWIEAIGHELKDGTYDVPNSWVRDYIIYRCPICGKIIHSTIEL